ncbi:MAG: hypothetical protein SGPRY_003611 [Prymnesium sp.]
MLAAGSRQASLRRLGLLSLWLAVWVVHASCHSPGRALQFGRLSSKLSNGINATAAGFVARCVDLKIECPSWAAAGLCKTDSTYMNATCQRSCGLCASEPRESVVPHWVHPRRGCLDREGYDCQTRAERGECLASANATAMKCPNSCKLCHFNSILKEAITCEDENLNCARWASEGECTTNPSYMESSCAVSCGMGYTLPSTDELSMLVLSERVRATPIDASLFVRLPCLDLAKHFFAYHSCFCPKLKFVFAVCKEVVRYDVGQFYRRHHDQNSGLFTPQGPRVYLSTPTEGGGTKFNDLGIAVPAVKGRAVLWPSVASDNPDRDEPRTHHEALPVVVGQKIACNIWVHNYDYRTPASRNCVLTHKNTH